MSADVVGYLQAGLAQGFSLEAIIAAAQAQLAAPSRRPTLAPAGTSEVGETTPLVEQRAAPPEASLTLAGGPVVPADSTRVPGLERYDDLGPLGIGGMGEVRRVRDRRLGRTLALKTLHARALERPNLVARFLEEAQATAQLQHPGIVPVHDLGHLPDGRLWFTMKEVKGQTFGAVIREVHAVSRRRWHPAPSGWTLRRLVDALRQVCEAVGYAHSRGVVHRDLKPANVMVGRHGEVLVLDWGLAKVLGRPDAAAAAGDLDPIQTERSAASAYQTQVGQVAGTPAYMPPEQALGQINEIDARSDVYALGAMLYEVLCGEPPYVGSDARKVLDQVRRGPPLPLESRGGDAAIALGFGLDLPSPDRTSPRPALPPSLVKACGRAMARAPDGRFASAAELAAELQAWLEGLKRQEEARAVVARAEDKRPEAAALRARAAALRAEAASLLEHVEDWQPETDKLPGWKREDAAAVLEKQAEMAEIEHESLLLGSLTHAPDLPEAHAALAARYRAEHAAAEAVRADSTRAETLFRQHLSALPEAHADRADHAAYLRGVGALSLVTDPPGAEVLLHRYVMHNRRLEARFERSLGTTPLRAAAVPMGSYLCTLRHPDRAAVRYPVSIGRGEHWDGISPEGSEPHPIVLPEPGELGPDDCYVPAGWFRCGGDPSQPNSLPAQRVWVDGWVVKRFPVTNRQYLAFLDSLVSEGRTEEALRHAPRERSGVASAPGALIFGFDGTRFILQADSDGDVWDPATAVCMVDWYGASAYAAWWSRQTGQPWRLPSELVWEKAARGVDGRLRPWGDLVDPSWTCMRESHRGPLLPRPIGAFPVDASPYDIRDLAGSMADWCADAHDVAGPDLASARTPPSGGAVAQARALDSGAEANRLIRGGSWCDSYTVVKATFRYWNVAWHRDFSVGFRLVRPALGTPC